MESNSLIKHSSGNRFLKIDQDYYELLGHDIDATLVLCILEGWFNFRLAEVRSGRETVRDAKGERVKLSALLVFRTHEQLMADSFGILSRNRSIAAVKKLVAFGLITIRKNTKIWYDNRNFYQLNISKINSLLAGLDVVIEEDEVEYIYLDETMQCPVQDDGSPTQHDSNPTGDISSPTQDTYNKNLKQELNEKQQQTNTVQTVDGGGSLTPLNNLKPSNVNDHSSGNTQKPSEGIVQELNSYLSSLNAHLPESTLQEISSWKLVIDAKRFAIDFCVLTGHKPKPADVQEKWITPLYEWYIGSCVKTSDIVHAVSVAKSEMNEKLGINWNSALITPFSYSHRVIGSASSQIKQTEKKRDMYDDKIDWAK